MERNLRKQREGIVTSNKMDKTITVEVQRRVKHPIYGKFVKKTSKLTAHDEKNQCDIGDLVRVMETRPISKNKRWRLTKIVEKVKLNEMSITDQIIDQESIYYLPLAMHVFDDETQKDVERVWAKQLERDGAFSELSTDNHKLALIIATDKNGNFPWDEDCESYWPEMCPPPLAAMAQMSILGEDTLLTKLESAYKKINTDNS